MHAGAVGLEHGGVAIDIDHAAGQEITLAMHQAEGIVVGTYQAQTLAQGPGGAQTPGIEGLVGHLGGV